MIRSNSKLPSIPQSLAIVASPSSVIPSSPSTTIFATSPVTPSEPQIPRTQNMSGRRSPIGPSTASPSRPLTSGDYSSRNGTMPASNPPRTTAMYGGGGVGVGAERSPMPPTGARPAMVVNDDEREPRAPTLTASNLQRISKDTFTAVRVPQNTYSPPDDRGIPSPIGGSLEGNVSDTEETAHPSFESPPQLQSTGASNSIRSASPLRRGPAESMVTAAVSGNVPAARGSASGNPSMTGGPSTAGVNVPVVQTPAAQSSPAPRRNDVAGMSSPPRPSSSTPNSAVRFTAGSSGNDAGVRPLPSAMKGASGSAGTSGGKAGNNPRNNPPALKRAGNSDASIALSECDRSSMTGSRASSFSMIDNLLFFVRDLAAETQVVNRDGVEMTEEEKVMLLTSSVSQAIRSMAPNAVIVMDRMAMIVDANTKSEEVFGRQRTDMVGKNIRMLMPPEVASKHDEYVRSFLERWERRKRAPRSNIVGAREPREVLAVRMLPNGKMTTFPAEVTIRGIPHPGGNHIPPLFFVGYVDDCTQKRQLREALEINDFIREKGDTPLIVISDMGKVLDVNAACADLFRYSRRFIVNQNVKKLMPPATAAGHDEKLRLHRERVVTGMLHSSPVVGKVRFVNAYRPKFEDDGSEEFRMELRVEAFSGGKVLVAFVRDVDSLKESKFNKNTTNDMFPAHTVERLIRGEPVWDRQENVTILFSDVVAFSAQSATMEAEEVFQFVNTMVSSFDELGYGMEKIKTIGDGYMAYFTNADDAAFTALRMLHWCSENGVAIRVGLHTGTVISGVIGTRRRTFDMWGDSVNIAKRMEETGVSGQLQISIDTYDCLMQDGLCKLFTERTVQIKSRGEMDVYITTFNGRLSDSAMDLMSQRDVLDREQRMTTEMATLSHQNSFP